MNDSRIAIFASGSGSNAEEIMKYLKDHPSIKVSLLLSNDANAYALERARLFSVPAKTFTRDEYLGSTILLDWLRQENITHLVLAGFLWLIPKYLLDAYPNRIINIHPALLPLFGGKGMFGMKVHQAVKASGAAETGITIHVVNEHYDEGEILFQGRCAVDAEFTPDDIAERVHQLEHKHYPPVIERWIQADAP